MSFPVSSQRLWKKLSSCVLLLVSSAVFCAPAHAIEAGDMNGCTAELLMDAGTGQVLHEANAHTPLPPASMVKIMVAYVTLKKVKEELVHWDDVVTTSAFASRVGGSQVYLKEGEQFTLRQMYDAVLIQSANDAAVAIAEHIGGAQEGFVEMMNIEARAIGMNESTFTSAHGLPPGKDQEPDLVSAHDMAILSRALMNEFPEVLETTAKIEGGFRNGAFIMRNHNHLLRSFQGCDGIKTGFYSKAGFCVTTTAKRKDTRLIAVVMGCKERKKRDAEAARLMSIGFAQYRTVKLVDEGAGISAAVPVVNGVLREIVPVARQAFTTIVRAGEEKNVVKKFEPCAELAAPIQKGTACGTMGFYLGDRELGKVDLVVPQEVQALGLTGKLLRMLGR